MSYNIVDKTTETKFLFTYYFLLENPPAVLL